MAFTQASLPYDYAALEPYIDTQTMQIHHGKHHAAYTTNFNNLIAGKAPFEGKSALEILKNLAAAPEDIRAGVRNNGGGYVNHTIFWELMAPKGQGGGGEPTGKLAEAIKSTFGSYADFKTKFQDAGVKRFGSGWAWLVLKGGKLAIGSTANQDHPEIGEGLLSGGISGTPVLTVDVWEHAYYLKYQNRRPDYLAAFWEVVNWKKAGELFEAASR